MSMFGGMDGVYNEGPDFQGRDVAGADDGLSLVGDCQPRRRWPDHSLTCLGALAANDPAGRIAEVRSNFSATLEVLQNSPAGSTAVGIGCSSVPSAGAGDDFR